MELLTFVFLNIIKPVVALLVPLLPIGLLILDRFFPDKNSKKYRRYHTGILVAMILVAGVSFSFNLHDSYNNKKYQEKIESLNEHAIKYVTGYDSYCFFDYRIAAGNPRNVAKRELTHVGDYPLYNTYIRTFNVTNSKNESIIYKENFFKLGQANFGVDAERITLPTDTDEQRYNIFYRSNNGDWTQQVVFRRMKTGEWNIATRIDGVVFGKKISEEYLPDNYPENADGKPLWQ